MQQPLKLTEFQLNRIIKRFTSKQSLHPLLKKPHQTSNFIIATDTHITLFLSNNATDIIISNGDESDETMETLSRLELNYMTQSSFEPSTSFTLDNEIMKIIIKHLKGTHKELQTKQTKTRIVYSKLTNEINLTSVTLDDYYMESDEHMQSKAHYEPTSILYDVDNDFEVAISTNYLISALMTQRETEQCTTIEYDAVEENNYIRMRNTLSTVIIECLSG